jgi:hypothetical protein
MSFPFTKFADVLAYALTVEDIEIERLKEAIEAATAPVKEQLPLGKLATFGTLPSPPDAGGKGGGSLRWDGNVLTVTGIEGDYDGEAMPIAEARDRLNAAGLAFVIHTTGRHTPQTPRWRVWLPFSKPLPPRERDRMVNRVNGVLGGVLARESWTLSQSFFIGRVEGVPFEIYIGDGEEFIDDAEELDTRAIPYMPTGRGRRTTGKGGKPDLKGLDENELVEEIKRPDGHRFHASGRLLWIWALQEIPKADAQASLEDIFDNIPQADHGPKWAGQRAAIPRWVDKIYARAAKHLGTYLARMRTFYAESPQFRGAIQLNRFMQTIEVCDPFPPVPGQVNETYRPLREIDVLRALLAAHAKDFPKASEADVWKAIKLAAEDQGYHPVQEYLSAEVWDQTPRIHRLFFDYFPGELPLEENLDWRDKWVAYYEHTARCFMVGAVARIFEPGCKVDSLPIFVSNQRYNKGLGLQALAVNPAWFTDDIPVDFVDKDCKDALVGKWIVELAEMPHLRRDVERFKAFVSRQSDRFRRAYERVTQDWPRQSALTGTSNDLTYLDVTGNRRFWAIPLARPADVKKIRQDRDQLWAEAVHLHRNKTPWWLSEELEAIAAEIQKGYVEDDLLDIPITDWLEKRRDAKTGEVAPFEMSALYPSLHQQLGLGSSLGGGHAAPALPSKTDQGRIASSLKRLGFRRAFRWIGGKSRRAWVEQH